jgi:DNA-binding HxlR family transcriptional regulator
MAHDPESPACRSVNHVLQRIGDKWSVLIVQMLAEGPRRFNELRRDIPTISQRMLTLSLRGLERDGLVSRKVTPSIPPRVDYELTPLGHSLRGPVSALAGWAIDNMGEIHEAQDRYDVAQDERDAA